MFWINLTDGSEVRRRNKDGGKRASVTVADGAEGRQQGKAKPASFGSTMQFEELKKTVDEWVQQTGKQQVRRNLLISAGVALVGVLSLMVGLFVVLIPGTYAAGGFLLYRNKGWKFFQPGVGGQRFIALNAVAWALYALSVIIQFVNFILHDPLLTFNAFMIGALSYVLIVAALFAYHPPNTHVKNGVNAPSDGELRKVITPTFNEELQESMFMFTSDRSPSFFWWIFIGMQASLVITSFVVCIVGNASNGSLPVRMITTTLCMWTICGACSTTHAMGGKWRHIQSNYEAFQPGKGGGKYIILQMFGWMAMSLGCVAGFMALASQVRMMNGHPPLARGLMALCGSLGLIAEAFIIASLFVYDDGTTPRDNVDGFKKMLEAEHQGSQRLLLKFARLQFRILNAIFGPSDPLSKSRKLRQAEPDAHLACEDKWAQATKDCKKTGDTYLVVGNGFVGKRLVNRLLERGEMNIRVFDIVPNNYWKGDDRVTFIRGDVTRPDQIGPACKGVDTCYSTFAIIRFMDRLEHQAFISYHINVTGTEVLFNALKENNVERVIVTSSSHATTDEDSPPRFNRDETSPLLTREQAHGHYGWTKAIADRLSIEADGTKLPNGKDMKVTVVRPCSGVFGADDRLSFEKVMELGVVPAIGPKAVMDWVYVENVVLGHLLAECALQDNRPGVRGEAFCISNEEPVSNEDFWLSTKKHIQRMPRVKRESLFIEYLYIPMAPLYVISYISEFVQWAFKGKVSLGKDVDILTPATLITATMSYTYTSKKAKRVLGYEPVFTLDEAIQRSLNEYYETHYKK
mmetsp:Transcript_4555/g.7905  ORF Transcript_4555/g.7905 Transcript_4555/m.7905 type:complete len:802 (+) Transcript_4555:362-2767(+)